SAPAIRHGGTSSSGGIRCCCPASGGAWRRAGDGMTAASQRVLVLGATSAIAERWCRLRAARGARLLLVARDPERLAVIAADLRARGAAEVLTAESDLADPEAAADRFADFAGRLAGLDLVLVAYGVLGDQ